VLVLSRKKNEAVKIPFAGVLIEIVVVEIRGDKVRLGFQAPREIPILRDELLDAPEAESDLTPA